MDGDGAKDVLVGAVYGDFVDAASENGSQDVAVVGLQAVALMPLLVHLM